MDYEVTFRDCSTCETGAESFRASHRLLFAMMGVSAQCRRTRKDGEDQAIGHSKGGLSTKIHPLVDALGNPC
jgi:hypothetical protein